MPEKRVSTPVSSFDRLEGKMDRVVNDVHSVKTSQAVLSEQFKNLAAEVKRDRAERDKTDDDHDDRIEDLEDKTRGGVLKDSLKIFSSVLATLGALFGTGHLDL
jgi:hypothetical protein